MKMKMRGRENDTTMVLCHRCGWRGKAMECTHNYESDEAFDVVPVDNCPCCESDNLEPQPLVAA